MIKGLYKFLLLVFAILIVMPITVFADVNTDSVDNNSYELNSYNEDSPNEEEKLDDENDSDEEELDGNNNELNNDVNDELNNDVNDELNNNENVDNDNDSNDEDDQLQLIKDSIKDVITINLLESEAYDYDENGYSIVNGEIVKAIETRLNDLGIDFNSLGYKFYSNFFNSNVFTYNGSINIIKDNSYVDSVVTTVVFSNTNEHTEEEQQYVDEFIENNDFNFQEEFYLDEYDENEFDVDSKVEEVSSNNNISSKSMIPPYAGTDKDFPYACFYNDKYYGKVIANIDRTIKVKVPANVSDVNSNALNQVKQYFIKYYSDLGINDFVTNNSVFYYSDGHIYLKDNNTSNDLDFGKYSFEQQSPSDNNNNNDNDNTDITEDNNQNNNTNVDTPIHNEPIVDTDTEYNNSNNNNYDNSSDYSSYSNYNYNYYTDYQDNSSDNQDGDISQVTNTLEEIDNKVKEQEKEIIKESENKTKKNTTIKNNNKTNNNSKNESTDKNKELEEDDSDKINAFKVLFITLAVILSIGVIIAVVNRIITSRNSIDI